MEKFETYQSSPANKDHGARQASGPVRLWSMGEADQQRCDMSELE